MDLLKDALSNEWNGTIGHLDGGVKIIVDDLMAEAERHAMMRSPATDFAPDKTSPEQPRIRNRREKRANQARNRRKCKPGKRRH